MAGRKKLLNQSEFAEKRGLHRHTVPDMIECGNIEVRRKTVNGRTHTRIVDLSFSAI